MSERHQILVKSQNSIYSDEVNREAYERDLKVYFSVPNEVTNMTGICMLIPGFGGNANSNIYKRMRDQIADEHNLVVVQCDYFGWEFMQDIPDENIVNNAFDVGPIIFKKLGETRENFADMGPMQALDHIVAVLNVMNILYNNNMEFNAKKIMLYGHSQGAYLAYLCNAMAPELFSLIIDNSAWLYPQYMNNDRQVNFTVSGDHITFNKAVLYHYLARDIIKDCRFMHLPLLYKKFDI